MAQRSDVTVPVEEEAMTEILESDDEAYKTHRFSVRRTKGTVALRPALADRPVVARPDHPLSVLPNEEVTLYLNTPLRMRVELVESERRPMKCPPIACPTRGSGRRPSRARSATRPVRRGGCASIGCRFGCIVP
ncbi:MAG: hypothetical protein BRD55_03505 [Bacteroidetes bacterium SW_9_63_38]|nr:MAG: hypothetical protein BRD55_03505 [Bacteroidetes bacterium SW_9_63_38]